MTFSVAAISPYSNSVTYALVSGSLPPGLSLNTTTGGITGTPTTISGVYAFGISATDAYSTTTRDFTMNTSIITWTNGANCGTFVQNTTVSLPLIATSSYNQPVTYSVTSGALPTGLSLSGSYISGVMPATGTYYFTVTAADGYSVSPLLMNVQSVSTPNTDAYAGNVVYLIHFDNSYNDAMGHTVTPSGSFSAAQVLLPSFSPNGAYNQCVYFDGSNSLLYSDPNTDTNLGSSDFTIEFSFNTASITGQDVVILGTLNNANWGINYNNNRFWFGCNLGSFNWTFAPTVGTWYNMAFVRNSGSLYFFVNGVQIGSSQSISGSVWYTTGQCLTIAGGFNNNFNGFLDEIRITLGLGRYTANYTVALPFPSPIQYQSPNGLYAGNNAVVTILGTGSFPLSVSSYYSNSVTYSLVSGTMPTGFTMNSTTGISGVANGMVMYNTNASLLMTFNAGTITDDTGQNSFTNTGSPTLSSTIVNNSTYSLSLNGSSGLIVNPGSSSIYNIGTNTFTLEMSVYMTSVSSTQTFIELGNNTNGHRCFNLYFSTGDIFYSGNNLRFDYSSTGSNVSHGGFSWSPSANTWYQIAIVRSGSTLYAFVNGTSIGTLTLSYSSLFGPSDVLIGYGGTSPANYFTGYMDNIRFILGVSLYTSNYTPPTTMSSIVSYGILETTPTTFNFVMDATDGYCNTQKAISATVYLPVTPIWVTPSGSLGSQAQNTNFATTLNAVANCITLTTSSSTSTAGNVLNFSSTTNVYPNMSIIGPYLPPNTTVFQVSSSQIITSKIIPAIPSGVTYNFTPAPVTYAVTTGALPSGLTLNALTGVISGSLPSVGTTTTTNFTVTAATIPSLNASQAFSITVQATSGTYGSSLSFRRPSGTVGTKVQQYGFAAYAQANSTLDMPITYSIASGALPTGLYLDNATGYINGVLPVVTTDTTSSFSVAASDGNSVAIQSFAITTAYSAITDAYANSVVAVLNFDAVAGTAFALIEPGIATPSNGGTTYPMPITDVKGHIVQAYIIQNGGYPVLENNIVRKGSGSIYLANTSAVLVGAFDSYSEFAIGTQDFTIEASFYLTALNSSATSTPFFSQDNNFMLYYYSGNIWLGSWNVQKTNGSNQYITYTPPTNTWLDIALVRHAGTYSVYVNGTSLGSFSGSGTVSSNLNGGTNNEFRIGHTIHYHEADGSLPGYVDEMRITIGVARYTSNYTVQAQPFS